jgi:DNA-binding transcriptional regulator/RsmH inhibitor MraZ
MAEWIVQPDGVGDVPCDSKWRVRLPTPYANYFLAFEPGKETAKLYTASLNADDILLWPKALLASWRDLLPRKTPEEAKQTRQLLAAVQFYGADTEIDRQGRFVLPRNLREALKLASPPKSFKIYNDGIIRLVTPTRFEIAKRDLAPPSATLDESAVTSYSALVGPNMEKQEGDSR